MEDIIQCTSIDSAVVDRAAEVQKQMVAVTDRLGRGYLTLCDLLLEAHAGAYHTVFGHGQFGDWVESNRDLDMSARTAYYMINIGKKIKALGLTADQIQKIKISSLKAIFELDPLENGADMRSVLAAAPDLTLDEVKDKVRALKVAAGKPDYVKMGPYKVEPLVKETIDESFELARRIHGSTVKDGEVVDISDSKCLELVCVEFLNDPNHREDYNCMLEDVAE